MNVGFDSKKLRDTCESNKLLESAYGQDLSGSLMSFFADLQAASSLSEMQSMYQFASLDDKVDEFKVLITTSCEITVRAVANKEVGRTNMEFDWSLSRRIKILKIVSHHA
jgi:hypothetical protein